MSLSGRKGGGLGGAGHGWPGPRQPLGGRPKSPGGRGTFSEAGPYEQ